ncbi:metallophosphoesterase [Spirochaeta cellobiosiphila]|uniref:metallophosphoesterase n=1 Tax=Spirochaeta cellobiosiphila TaxID=504483 RepID=UPI0003F69B07|nr:metallophosphoesterase [Spirochaeta cellobiosiphila]
MTDYKKMLDRLKTIFFRKKVLDPVSYLQKVDQVNGILMTEDQDMRPVDQGGLPGGLIKLLPVETIIIPDLHARMDFILSLMEACDFNGSTVLERLTRGDLQIVCVGDGFHGEGRVRNRWLQAFEEFQGGFRKHKYMDAEMRESLGLMEMIIELKIAFPQHFHFLKGNHENIANENGNGNYPFGKFAMEGQMVTDWVQMYMSDDFFASYYDFEANLPLMALGSHFIVTHAEPARFYNTEEIINYRTKPEVIYGLTWTANEEAEKDSVNRSLEHFLGKTDKVFHFGGHRPIAGSYFTRANGKYVQIHNPNRFIVAWLPVEGSINLDTHIFEIPNITLKDDYA